MIDPKKFLSSLAANEFSFFTGVPCSLLGPLISEAYTFPGVTYIPATIEGEGISLAVGAHLAGTLPVVMLQNSGLGNCINPLASLAIPYDIPALLIVSWRGEPLTEDEPHHQLMGEITLNLLKLLGIESQVIYEGTTDWERIIARAKRTILQNKRPFALIVKKGTFDWASLKRNQVEGFTNANVFSESDRLPISLEIPRADLFRTIFSDLHDCPLIASTGFNSRALHEIGDRNNHFYMQGSMGFALPIALGVSLQIKGEVAVVDGDSSLLMRMGNLFTAANFAQFPIVYILNDNRSHQSTGGQDNVSPHIDYQRLAEAAGTQSFSSVASKDELSDALKRSRYQNGLNFIHVRTKSEPKLVPSRPSIELPALSTRFTEFLRSRELWNQRPVNG